MANEALERDWDTQIRLAAGDDVKASIGILRCSQHAHRLWRDWLIRNPQAPSDGQCAEDVDAAWHQRCIDEYEKIIGVIERLQREVARLRRRFHVEPSP